MNPRRLLLAAAALACAACFETRLADPDKGGNSSETVARVGGTIVDADGNPVTTVTFGHDLIELAGGTDIARDRRSFFCFRGFALADLALAHLAVVRARERGIGIDLPR